LKGIFMIEDVKLKIMQQSFNALRLLLVFHLAIF